MKVSYDKQTDSMTIVFRDVPIKESDEVKPGLIMDFGYDDQLVRVEILDASKVVQKASEIQFSMTE